MTFMNYFNQDKSSALLLPLLINNHKNIILFIQIRSSFSFAVCSCRNSQYIGKVERILLHASPFQCIMVGSSYCVRIYVRERPGAFSNFLKIILQGKQNICFSI